MVVAVVSQAESRVKFYSDGERLAIYCGDCRTEMVGFPSDSVDAIITDPPYELGFMGKAWDGTGVAYDVEIAAKNGGWRFVGVDIEMGSCELALKRIQA